MFIQKDGHWSPLITEEYRDQGQDRDNEDRRGRNQQLKQQTGFGTGTTHGLSL